MLETREKAEIRTSAAALRHMGSAHSRSPLCHHRGAQFVRLSVPVRDVFTAQAPGGARSCWTTEGHGGAECTCVASQGDWI